MGMFKNRAELRKAIAAGGEPVYVRDARTGRKTVAVMVKTGKRDPRTGMAAWELRIPGK